LGNKTGYRQPDSDTDFIFGKFLLNFFDILKQMLIDINNNYLSIITLLKRRSLIKSVLNKLTNNSYFLGYFNNTCLSFDKKGKYFSLPSEITLNSKILHTLNLQIIQQRRYIDNSFLTSIDATGKIVGNCWIDDDFYGRIETLLDTNLPLPTDII
jgi:hypothetical protein